MVDHSPIINTTSTNPNPQHHRNNVICKMLVRNNQCGSETLPLFHANKMSPHSPDICTSPSPESCRVPHSEPLPDLCNKKKTTLVLPQATQSCEKQRRRVRFDLPRRMNKTPTCPEYARPRPNSGTKRTISAPQPITPQNWQTMDFETRRAASLKPNTAIESERFISTREKLFHHMNLIRKMGNEVTDQQTCVDGDKENSVVDDDESDDGNDDEKEGKPEEADQADAGKSSGYKEICTPGSDESSRLEEKAQTLPKVYKDIKLIQRAGKFIPNRINILNPNYLCSKSTSCKRYHHLFKDLVPDLRDNYKYGKRVNFYGFNSSSFRG
ncbi:hypothetical protein SNE40_005659 [Patella caerulea]|uniref:Uncharacterized protein n=1 Tax=Patella caerulea TaxID=87958 RepID=A0AAN8K540_PATCE